MQPNLTTIQPTLFIIAGPNGAGKSTTSRDLLDHYGITAFDWDFEFDRKHETVSYDPEVEEGVADSTTEQFNRHIQEAIQAEQSVAFETNFHTEIVMKHLTSAKSNGFNVVLYYPLIQDVRICMQRVRKRVKEGGHFVSNETITERYNQGLELLDTHFMKFDQVHLYNASEHYDMSLLATLGNGTLLNKVNSISPELSIKLPKLSLILED